ncbi:hypothetical protein NX794_15850 [Streptomyces sp. LP11]|uniref:HNH endonuclease n=1 Tax=Streptomyces pyxinicus TaxID=2970331 RepID=A0ABT2B402_9ACTN|nr:hypothetical protein [Streptomyces sp. LP11]MCS0602673.1 hypothetical protein [Streptomyces sp. LP11]
MAVELRLPEAAESSTEAGVRPIRYWNGTPVPYITAWSGEQGPGQPIKRIRGRGGTGLGFQDEHHFDRQYGVLWARKPVTRGGRPVFDEVHPLRQRQAMSRLLCQVCGGPTGSRRDERSLFMVASPSGRLIEEGQVVVAPPVHRVCAEEAREHCPSLRKGWTAALVGYAPVWGVSGQIFDPDTLDLLPGDKNGMNKVPFTASTLLRWTLAAALMVALKDVLPVADLAEAIEGGAG